MSMRRTHRASLPLRLAILAILLLAAVAWAPPATRADGTIAVTSEAAAPHFPGDITFTLAATSARPIARVELLYTAAGQETLNLATPSFTPGPQLAITYKLDMRATYLPPGLDIAYHWQLTDAAGNVTETAPRTLLWQDDRFAWQSYRTDQVTVYAYNGDETFDRHILDTAQRTIDKLEQDFKVARSRPIRIWIYDSAKDYSAALEANSEPWSIGASYTGYYLVLSVIPRGDEGEVRRVIPHEVSHQVLYQATKNPFNLTPRWLDEGLAMYNQQCCASEDEGFVRDAVKAGRLDSIRALNADFPYDSDATHLAYGESFSIVSFIINHYGKDKMAALIAVFRDGVSYDEAIQRGLGVTLDELDNEWQASLGVQGRRPASASTRRDERGGPAGGLSNQTAAWLASGVLAMAVAALIALAAGFLAVRRARQPGGEVFPLPESPPSSRPS